MGAKQSRGRKRAVEPIRLVVTPPEGARRQRHTSVDSDRSAKHSFWRTNSGSDLDDQGQTPREDGQRKSSKEDARKLSKEWMASRGELAQARARAALAQARESRPRRSPEIHAQELRRSATEPHFPMPPAVVQTASRTRSRQADMSMSFQMQSQGAKHQGNIGDVASAKVQEVQAKLMETRGQDLASRRQTFRTLCLQWHASRNDGTPAELWAETVYKHLLEQRDWYLGPSNGAGTPMGKNRGMAQAIQQTPSAWADFA